MQTSLEIISSGGKVVGRPFEEYKEDFAFLTQKIMPVNIPFLKM